MRRAVDLTLPPAAAAAAAVTARVEPRLLLLHVTARDTSLTEYEHCDDAGELENCQRILEHMRGTRGFSLQRPSTEMIKGGPFFLVCICIEQPRRRFFHVPDVCELRNGFIRSLFQRDPRLT